MGDFKIGDYVKLGEWPGFITDQIKAVADANLYIIECANLQDNGYPYEGFYWSSVLAPCTKEEFLQTRTKSAKNLIEKLEKRITGIKETYLEN